MSVMKKFASHSAQYFTAELLVTLSGLISFPIFTRILSTGEYGTMSIVTATLTMFAMFAGAGFRPSLLRFYGEYAKKNEARPIQLLATLFWTIVVCGGVGVLVLASLRFWLPERFLTADAMDLLAMFGALLVIRAGLDYIFALFRIQEKTIHYSVGYVCWKYFGLALSVWFVAGLGLRLRGLYLGCLLGEGLVFLLLTAYLLVRYRRAFFFFSKRILADSARYGIPLMGQNLASFVNNLGSRYVIQYMLGSVAVAVYTVGFNLAYYVQNLFVNALNTALIPLTMNTWAKEGPEETGKLLTRYMTFYALLFFPVVFGLTAIAEPAVNVIATSKYAEASGLIAWIIAGVMMAGAFFPATAVLRVHDKTIYVALIMAGAATLNIGFNIALIPMLGLRGAAIATLISCSAQVSAGLIVSMRFMRFRLEWAYYLLYALCAALMFAAIKLLPSDLASEGLSLLLKIAYGVVAYGLAILILDRRMRGYATAALNGLRSKLGH